jgi:hypothetical protein
MADVVFNLMDDASEASQDIGDGFGDGFAARLNNVRFILIPDVVLREIGAKPGMSPYGDHQ